MAKLSQNIDYVVYYRELLRGNNYFPIMKYFSIILLYLLAAGPTLAQVADTPRHIILTDLVVSAKKSESGKVKRKARSFNSFFIIKPGMAKDGHEVYFTTLCAPLNPGTTKLYNVELKLAPYDTTLFAMKAIILQAKSTGDTTYHSLDIHGSDINKKKMVMDVKSYNIILEPSNFYIGYAFIPKEKLKEDYTYRIYQNDNGEGAIIVVKDNKARIGNTTSFGYNFPFKISYITL